MPVPVNHSSGSFQKLFSFGFHCRTKKKSILSTYLSSNCFSVMGQSPPLILQLTFALVTIQEASATLGGKSVKCDVTKIPFKINNDQLSPSHRYLGEKFYSLKELMDSLCTHVLVLHAKGRLHPRITAVLAASTHLKIPHPADAVPISLFSEISYPMRVLVF